MIVITDAALYRWFVQGSPVGVRVFRNTTKAGAWHPIAEPWAIRKLQGGYAIEYQLTSESFFFTREGLEVFVLPPETWHPAERLLECGGFRRWCVVRQIVPTASDTDMAIVQITTETQP
jgi:hypothetical protein